MIHFNAYQYQAYSQKPQNFSGKLPNAEKMAKDIDFSDLYGTQNLGKLELNGKKFDVQTVGGEYFGIKNGEEILGYIISTNRQYHNKSCYSVAEIRNHSTEKGIGVKLMQIAFKAHQDAGKTGEFRAHDVIISAEGFYEKLGMIEDPKYEGVWYLPKENEHILENYNGGL